jgi:hypothetical protein
MSLTVVQQQAFDRITVLRQIEQRTGRSYGPVEKKVLADLHREDVIAGGALYGFDTTVTK